MPFCGIGASQLGYVTPVAIVESGAKLRWATLDSLYHSASSPDHALNVLIQQGEHGVATFEVREDGLYVLSEPRTEWERSTAAVEIGDGSYALEYTCWFHPQLQKGTVIVTPPVT